jgi:hypothetical protein
MVAPTGGGDYAVLVYVCVSAVLNVGIVLVFGCVRAAHPVVRARGVHMLGMQVVSGTLWACGTFVSFEHLDSLRAPHARVCALTFWATWVWGCCLFVCLICVRLHRLWHTFFAPSPRERVVWKLLAAHMTPPILIGCALLSIRYSPNVFAGGYAATLPKPWVLV